MNKNQSNILIFTSIAGGGHLSISQSMQDIILDHTADYSIIVINTTFKAASKIYQFIGNNLTKTVSSYWEWTNTPENSAFLAKLHLLTDGDKIQKAIKKYHPQLIISTDSFSVHTVQQTIFDLNLKTPHIVVIADPFTIHHIWTFEKKATLYLVPTEEARKVLISRKIPRSRIKAVGFPVRKEFYLTKPQSAHPAKTRFFIGGSGEGLGNIYRLLIDCGSKKELIGSASFTVVCGKNKPIYKKIASHPKINNLDLDLYGYSENMVDLINASQVVVGKPGPNILYESLLLCKPFIATHEPLRQELGNYDFIDRTGIGYSATSTALTVQKMISITENRSLLKKLQPNIKKQRKLQLLTPAKIWGSLRRYLR